MIGELYERIRRACRRALRIIGRYTVANARHRTNRLAASCRSDSLDGVPSLLYVTLWIRLGDDSDALKNNLVVGQSSSTDKSAANPCRMPRGRDRSMRLTVCADFHFCKPSAYLIDALKNPYRLIYAPHRKHKS